jgi:hypothetical protein
VVLNKKKQTRYL